MLRIDGMVGIGITMVVNVEVPFILRLQCFVLPYFQYERHGESPSTAPHYPLGIHSQEVANDWSLILMGCCGLVVAQFEAVTRI
jgi:hypothetical protein